MDAEVLKDTDLKVKQIVTIEPNKYYKVYYTKTNQLDVRTLFEISEESFYNFRVDSHVISYMMAFKTLKNSRYVAVLKGSYILNGNEDITDYPIVDGINRHLIKIKLNQFIDKLD